MAIFSHQPAVVCLETGDVAAIVSEPSQRARGFCYLKEPISKNRSFICYETPRRRERLGWLYKTVQGNFLVEPCCTPIFILGKSVGQGSKYQNLRYLRHAQSLSVAYCQTTKEFHVYFYWSLFTPPSTDPPQTGHDVLISFFLSDYKTLPIPWTLTLEEYEPHFKQVIEPDPQFPFLVGDPPLDPGGAWAGIYNNFDESWVFLTGGSGFSKNFDPFQITDAHGNLPSTPGQVLSDLVQRSGSLINLTSIADSLNDHTQHLYHQREIQATRYGTRVLMFAKGRLVNLIMEEFPATFDDPSAISPGLTVGAAVLKAGFVGEYYVGINFIVFVIPPPTETGGGPAVTTPGVVGHQFLASGGNGNYEWCLRRTRSSVSDPARTAWGLISPLPPLPFPPYPFDDFGDLLVPEPDFPLYTQGGGMPPGMYLTKDGLFYGTPQETGIYVFRLHVKDSNGLRGEATILFDVLLDEFQTPLCFEPRGVYPTQYKASISYVDIPSLSDPSKIVTWEGQVGAIGGETGKYLFTILFKSDPPKQQVPQLGGSPILEISPSDGFLTMPALNSSNFDSCAGVWVFEVQVQEYFGGIPSLPSPILPPPTCDRRGVAVSIGTTLIAGVDDLTVSTIPDGLLPEGKYSSSDGPARDYLILDSPVVVEPFPQGKNVYLAGNVSYFIAPGNPNNPGNVVVQNPGMMSPVQMVGLRQDTLTPAYVCEDVQNSNPGEFFRDIYDRFEESVSSPAPPVSPGSPPASGGAIDVFIQVGKRIRPLWPL